MEYINFLLAGAPGILTLDQVAVLLLVIIFFLILVLVWIKVTASNQKKETRELMDDLERVLIKDTTDNFMELQSEFTKKLELMRLEIDTKIDRMRDSQSRMFEVTKDSSTAAITTLSKDVQDSMHQFLKHTTDSLESIRTSVSTQLNEMVSSNERKLDEMRNVVDEKLEKTLESRLQKSFETVSMQLENVNKGLGEMKTIAQSVGSLSRTLSGIKSRGILGEVALGQIIEDMLPATLYDKEVSTVPGSTARVEYAVKLPGTEQGTHVYLPIDSKFPIEPYEALLNSYESGEASEIDSNRRALYARIKGFAKDITSKYISPPETTNFGIMFLPTEGLYAEIAREATFFEELRQSGVVIVGPTTLSAMLNSLQMGFKTLQIQKNASDIEKTLGAVKKEFGTFEDVLKKAHQRITQVGSDIENLVGTRTRAINRSLRDVQLYNSENNENIENIEEVSLLN